MIVMAFVGGKNSMQIALLRELEKKLKGCYRVKHIDNGSAAEAIDKKYMRLHRAIRASKPGSLVRVVTGISTQYELALLRRHKATICILNAPLPELFYTTPIAPEDLFICLRPWALDTPQKRKKYITPEEAFSICYGRYRGFLGAA
ncbi:TPA: hypothetical protein ACQVH3_004659 [Serratia marcescens]